MEELNDEIDVENVDDFTAPECFLMKKRPHQSTPSKETIAGSRISPGYV